MKKYIFIGIGILIALNFIHQAFFVDKPKSESKPPDKPKEIELPKPQPNINVYHLNTKEVDGKYRYFFRIVNDDSIPFIGDVVIKLINVEGREIFNETFSWANAIDPRLGRVVYMDTYFGPVKVYGSNGMNEFRWSSKRK